jgi:UDP-2-acetamido-2,6-beta-L-arabino-hexul-4-ose reductase
MRIGITGAQGFIGKHLIDELKNKAEISGFDLPENDLLDPACLEKFVADKDVVIHTAAVNRGSDSDIIETGIIGTHNLVSAIKKSKRKIKIVFLSSIQAENNTVFGTSKRFAETMLKDFSEKNKVPVIALRVVNVFGEGCKPYYNSVVATFCYQTKKNEKLKIDQSNKKINFIYVKDLTKIIAKEVFDSKKKGFSLKKIKTKNYITIKELAQKIKSFKKNKDPKEIKLKFHRDLYKTFLSY